MINPNLLFFCTMCREKAPQEISKIKCVIPHSTRHYKRGEHIASQGDSVSHLYMLTKGKVKTEIISDSGLILPIEIISAPYPLGAEFFFADDNSFPINVVALVDCEVLIIGRESIEAQIFKCSGFMRGFMTFNANRIRAFSERLKLFAQKSIKAKVGYYILTKEVKGAFYFDQSIADLAEYFCVERSSLSRAIYQMVRDKIITFDAGQGTIVNYDALDELLK